MGVVRHKEVLDALGQRIVDGVLAPGEAVTLAEICAEFGVSRTVAREAMRILEQLGMVRPRPRVGIVVQDSVGWSQYSPRVVRWHLDGVHRISELRMLAQLRLAVEPVAARLAAVHATDAERETFRSLAREFVQAREDGSQDRFFPADKRFHELLVRASGNTLFQGLESVTAALLDWRRERGLLPTNPDSDALAAHATVSEAIAEGDAKRAASAVRIISEQSYKELVAALV